jgi:hypothetical protein
VPEGAQPPEWLRGKEPCGPSRLWRNSRIEDAAAASACLQEQLQRPHELEAAAAAPSAAPATSGPAPQPEPSAQRGGQQVPGQGLQAEPVVESALAVGCSRPDEQAQAPLQLQGTVGVVGQQCPGRQQGRGLLARAGAWVPLAACCCLAAWRLVHRVRG